MTFPDIFQRTRGPLALPAPSPGAEALPGSGRTLPFLMETQEHSNWCWSAVAVSVARFYPPFATIAQCTLASLELNTDVCCTNPELCDVQHTLETSLQQVGHFNDMVFDPLEFAATETEINGERPLGCRIGWFGGGGGGHFVVIHGTSRDTSSGSLKQWVAVADPKFGPSDYLIEDFTNAYRQEGAWTHSYLTQ